MTSFLFIASLLVLAAAALLAWPLRQHRVIVALVMTVIPAAALGGYFLTSSWSWDAASHAAEQADDASGFDQAVKMLEDKLREQPGDVEGWKLLGRTRLVMGEYPAAVLALERAFDLTRGQDVEALLGYAEAIALTDESQLDGRAGEMFERGLAMDPANGRALWYGGLVAYRRNAFELARQRWGALMAADPPAQLREFLQVRLAELDQRLGTPVAPAIAPVASPAGQIQLQLSVASDIAARVTPAATLFVIARRDEAGPPLAVVRRSAGELPLALSISDADAMLPGMSLAGGGPLRLVARISQSGQPVAASGDLYGEVSYDFSSSGPVSLRIDRTVP